MPLVIEQLVSEEVLELLSSDLNGVLCSSSVVLRVFVLDESVKPDVSTWERLERDGGEDVVAGLGDVDDLVSEPSVEQPSQTNLSLDVVLDSLGDFGTDLVLRVGFDPVADFIVVVPREVTELVNGVPPAVVVLDVAPIDVASVLNISSS